MTTAKINRYTIGKIKINERGESLNAPIIVPEMNALKGPIKKSEIIKASKD